MRKGRSQRKTRGSLPPTSKRPQSRLQPGQASDGPQVVVGLTAPRSEALDSCEAVETLSNGAAEAERLELVREQSLEIVRESVELVRESLVREKLDAAAAEEAQEPVPASVEAAPASDEAPVTSRVETLTFDLPQAFQDAPDDDAVNVRATVPVKETTEFESSPVLIPTPSSQRRAQALTVLTPDEMSIPPMGDLSVEPIADRFFSEGELVAARGIDETHEEWDERAHKSVRKSLPEVVQRRARFAKYVRWAVGGAAVVCLAALARTALPPSASTGSTLASSRASLESRDTSQAPAAKAAAAAVVEAEPAKIAEPVEPVEAPAVAAAPAAPEPAAAAAQVAAEPVKTADPEPAKAPEPAAGAVAAAAPAAPAVATGDKTALQEKNDSRRALERGKVADAIAAGERSVALDATDGEAWLLLGAAYQEKGNNAEARRCYTACVKEGKRGPIGECRSMVR